MTVATKSGYQDPSSRTELGRQKLGRPFILLWFGQMLSTLGSGMTAFALGIYAFQTTGTVSSFSGIIAALYLPAMVLKPIGGVMADRFDRKTLIVLGDVGGAAVVVTLLAQVMAGGGDSFSLIGTMAIVAVGSCFAAVREPAYKASVSDLIDRSQYSRAAGLVQLASAAQHLLSPVAAGALIGIAGIRLILVADAVTFGVAIGLAATLPAMLPRVTAVPRSGTWKNLRRGWDVIVETPGVLPLVMVISAVTLCVGFVQTLFPPMMLARITPSALGGLQSLSATGMIAASLVLGVVPIERHLGRLLVAGLGLAGAGVVALGVSQSIFFTACAFFVFFSALPLINTGAESLIRRRIDSSAQGRAWGLIGLVSQIGYLVAYLSAGPLADRVFEPLVMDAGWAAGRGMAAMLALSGLVMMLLAGLRFQQEEC